MLQHSTRRWRSRARIFVKSTTDDYGEQRRDFLAALRAWWFYGRAALSEDGGGLRGYG